MKKYLSFLLYVILLMSCQTEQMPMEAGQHTALSTPSLYLDAKSTKNVLSFQSAYERKTEQDRDAITLLPYNFEKKEIVAPQLAEKGIPICGIHYACVMIACCKFRSVDIDVYPDQKCTIEGEPVSKASLRKWLRRQILNYGYLPRFSDFPQEALFMLRFDHDQPLSDANLLIYELVTLYEEFLEERAAIENMSIAQAKATYPLNLMFASKPPPMLPLSSDEQEIMDEIELEMDAFF